MTLRYSVVKRLVFRAAAVVVIFTLGLGGAAAGIYYEAIAEADFDPGTGANVTRMAVRGWAEGLNGKQIVAPAAGATNRSTTWLVTRDGGETVNLVNPDDKSYSVLKMSELKDSMASSLNSLGGSAELSFRDPAKRKLVEEEGPDMLGYATVHTAYETSYEIEIKISGVTQKIEILTLQEYWTADAIDSGSVTWPGGGSPAVGVPGLDAILDEQNAAPSSGFPLKSVVVSTTKVQGHVSTTRVVTEVTRLEERELDDSVFAIPQDYDHRSTLLPRIPALPYSQ